jgi:hypothetical protein
VERRSRLIPFLVFACLYGVWAQSATRDALKLLDDVSKHYADAYSHHIEAIRESRSSSELMSSWQKEILRAEEAPGNRYRFEGRSFGNSGIVVSDGVTEWNHTAPTTSTLRGRREPSATRFENTSWAGRERPEHKTRFSFGRT